MKKTFLLFLAGIATCVIASGQNSEHGFYQPTAGTLRALVVFAEAVGDPNYKAGDHTAWPPIAPPAQNSISKFSSPIKSKSK